MQPNPPLPNQPDGDVSPPGQAPRRDIFYEPTPEEKAAARSSTLSIGEMQILQGPPKSRKRIFLTIGSVAAGLMLMVIVLSLVLGGGSTKKPANDQATSSNNSSSSADQITTSCYIFVLPQPHDPISESEECAGSYLSGETRAAGVVVKPSFFAYLDLNELVNDWKKINPNISVKSEADLEFGPYSAKTLTWQSAETGEATMQSILVFVGVDPLGSANYQSSGSPITGFEIVGRYDQHEDSKFIFDDILASWQWL